MATRSGHSIGHTRIGDNPVIGNFRVMETAGTEVGKPVVWVRTMHR